MEEREAKLILIRMVVGALEDVYVGCSEGRAKYAVREERRMWKGRARDLEGKVKGQELKSSMDT
jgi:hypothetical protein